MISAKVLLTSGSHRLTPFQLLVFNALCAVPEGKVTTYKLLATKIGCKSSQAVGQALKRNPYAPTVPCHRVVASQGKLGGFGGSRSGSKIDQKVKLLKEEGVRFDENMCVASDCIYSF